MAENINLKTVDTVDTRPFKKLVMTIGELPTSFIESMTYYELLAWFTNYLETVIIPTVNNNAEAVEELQTLFTELKSFVDNYFDNLDVQEEINNKLDQMAEDGQLTQLIAQFLSLNAVMSFTSVASMKLAENLVNGSTCETYGFYAANDGGGAKYLVRTITNDDVVDEKTIIELHDDYLIAELIKEDTMNVKQFGAKGDNLTDDTLAIQTALNYSKNVEVPSGTYMVDAVTHININSGNKLMLSNDATIKAITTSQDNYAVILCDDVDNVEICGGTIEGERTTHTGLTGEWGMCISITNGSTNISIHDINLINAWGDGLYVNTCEDVKTHNLIINNARRNGISIISAVNFCSLNDTIKNTNGTAPQAGVDIEPNYDTDKLENIKFINTTTENNTNSGIMFNVLKAIDCSIDIINHSDNGSLSGLYVSKSQQTSGFINISESGYTNNKSSGIVLRGCYNSDCVITITKPTILGCNTNESASKKYGASIACYSESGDADYPIGNIIINEPYATNSVANQVPLSFVNEHNTENSKFVNVKIFNPLNTKTNNSLYASANDSIDINIVDNYENLCVTFMGTLTVYAQEYYSTLKFTGNTSRTTTIDPTTKIGKEFTLKNLGTLAHNLKIPDDQYCLQLGNRAGLTITLPKTGDSIKLKKFDATHWIVVSANCTPTIA